MTVAKSNERLASVQSRIFYKGEKHMEKLPLLLAFTAIVSLIFLALREVVCWYWKVNRGILLLEEGVQLLRQLRDAANRGEQDALDRQAAALKQGATQGSRPPALNR